MYLGLQTSSSVLGMPMPNVCFIFSLPHTQKIFRHLEILSPVELRHCIPTNRPSVAPCFLINRENLIVILPFVVGAADLQILQICCPAEEKHAGSIAKLLFN